MSLFQNYNRCVYCNSKKLKKEKKQIHPKNFYVEAIKSDLKLTDKKLNKILVYKCQNCKILQNNPWFSKKISKIIYSNIYGQHNRNWTNYINFINKNNTPNHGHLFKILSKSLNIKRYAEYNSPFMGLYLNFFKSEYKNEKNSYKDLSKNLFNYFKSRQVAGKSKNIQKKYFKNSINYFLKYQTLKKKYKLKNSLNKKYLFIDNSKLSWGQNDNHNSVNSRTFASEMFNLEVLDCYEKFKFKKIDLFGIFHTLDHTFEPKKILNYALKISKYVVVYCHADKTVNKQHLFSITNSFLDYLNKSKIYTFNLTKRINKNFKSEELYFICSKNKRDLEKLKKNFEN